MGSTSSIIDSKLGQSLVNKKFRTKKKFTVSANLLKDQSWYMHKYDGIPFDRIIGWGISSSYAGYVQIVLEDSSKILNLIFTNETKYIKENDKKTKIVKYKDLEPGYAFYECVEHISGVYSAESLWLETNNVDETIIYKKYGRPMIKRLSWYLVAKNYFGDKNNEFKEDLIEVIKNL
jgi:hypothetical protein